MIYDYLNARVGKYELGELRKYSRITRVPLAQYLRAGIDLILHRLENNIPIWDKNGNLILGGGNGRRQKKDKKDSKNK